MNTITSCWIAENTLRGRRTGPRSGGGRDSHPPRKARLHRLRVEIQGVWCTITPLEAIWRTELTGFLRLLVAVVNPSRLSAALLCLRTYRLGRQSGHRTQQMGAGASVSEAQELAAFQAVREVGWAEQALAHRTTF